MASGLSTSLSVDTEQAVKHATETNANLASNMMDRSDAVSEGGCSAGSSFVSAAQYSSISLPSVTNSRRSRVMDDSKVRLMSEEEISSLVHNALRRARQASTTGVSPRLHRRRADGLNNTDGTLASSPRTTVAKSKIPGLSSSASLFSPLSSRPPPSPHSMGQGASSVASTASPTAIPAFTTPGKSSATPAIAASTSASTSASTATSTSTNAPATDTMAGKGFFAGGSLVRAGVRPNTVAAAVAAMESSRARAGAAKGPGDVTDDASSQAALDTLLAPSSSSSSDGSDAPDEQQEIVTTSSTMRSDLDFQVSVDLEDDPPGISNTFSIASVNSGDAVVRRVEREIAAAREAAEKEQSTKDEAAPQASSDDGANSPPSSSVIDKDMQLMLSVSAADDGTPSAVDEPAATETTLDAASPADEQAQPSVKETEASDDSNASTKDGADTEAGLKTTPTRTSGDGEVDDLEAAMGEIGDEFGADDEDGRTGKVGTSGAKRAPKAASKGKRADNANANTDVDAAGITEISAEQTQTFDEIDNSPTDEMNESSPDEEPAAMVGEEPDISISSNTLSSRLPPRTPSVADRARNLGLVADSAGVSPSSSNDKSSDDIDADDNDDTRSQTSSASKNVLRGISMFETKSKLTAARKPFQAAAPSLATETPPSTKKPSSKRSVSSLAALWSTKLTTPKSGSPSTSSRKLNASRWNPPKNNSVPSKYRQTGIPVMAAKKAATPDTGASSEEKKDDSDPVIPASAGKPRQASTTTTTSKTNEDADASDATIDTTTTAADASKIINLTEVDAAAATGPHDEVDVSSAGRETPPVGGPDRPIQLEANPQIIDVEAIAAASKQRDQKEEDVVPSAVSNNDMDGSQQFTGSKNTQTRFSFFDATSVGDITGIVEQTMNDSSQSEKEEPEEPSDTELSTVSEDVDATPVQSGPTTSQSTVVASLRSRFEVEEEKKEDDHFGPSSSDSASSWAKKEDSHFGPSSSDSASSSAKEEEEDEHFGASSSDSASSLANEEKEDDDQIGPSSSDSASSLAKEEKEDDEDSQLGPSRPSWAKKEGNQLGPSRPSWAKKEDNQLGPSRSDSTPSLEKKEDNQLGPSSSNSASSLAKDEDEDNQIGPSRPSWAKKEGSQLVSSKSNSAPSWAKKEGSQLGPSRPSWAKKEDDNFGPSRTKSAPSWAKKEDNQVGPSSRDSAPSWAKKQLRSADTPAPEREIPMDERTTEAVGGDDDIFSGISDDESSEAKVSVVAGSSKSSADSEESAQPQEQEQAKDDPPAVVKQASEQEQAPPPPPPPPPPRTETSKPEEVLDDIKSIRDVGTKVQSPVAAATETETETPTETAPEAAQPSDPSGAQNSVDPPSEPSAETSTEAKDNSDSIPPTSGVTKETPPLSPSRKMRPHSNNRDSGRGKSKASPSKSSKSSGRPKKVRFRQRYPVPPLLKTTRPSQEIIRKHELPDPEFTLHLAKPKADLKHLMDAIHGDSITRRSNACGALMVLTTKAKNKLTLVRTAGFLDALVFAINANLCQEDFDIALDARSRAVLSVLNVSEPKDNRGIVLMHEGLTECLLKCIMEDRGEARSAACSVFAMIAKTPACRGPMGRAKGVIDVLARILSDENFNFRQYIEVNGNVDVDVEAFFSDDEDSEDEDGSQLSKSYSSNSSSSSSSSENFSARSIAEVNSMPAVQRVDSIRQSKMAQTEEMAKRGRLSACAAMLHLSKHCSVSTILTRSDVLIATLVHVSKEYDNPMHTKCLETICNLTRFPSNNGRLARFPGLVDALVKGGRVKIQADRAWSLRSLQNLSSDAAGKTVLANATVLNLLSVSAMRNQSVEKFAAVATLYNLTTEPGAVVPLTNTKNVVATLVHVAHNQETESDIRLMACDALATLGLWLQTLAGAGSVPEEVQQVPLPSYVSAGWKRWD